MTDMKDLQHRALIIANHYDDYNRQVGRKGWDARDYTEGLVGDVGDLMKAIMAVHDRRDMLDATAKVEHELNDVMWSLLVLYKLFQLDPAISFQKAMDELEKRLINMKQAAQADIKS
jgi:NTP pyrophosphatase (non-canonical NTP hydrolase)